MGGEGGEDVQSSTQGLLSRCGTPTASPHITLLLPGSESWGDGSPAELVAPGASPLHSQPLPPLPQAAHTPSGTTTIPRVTLILTLSAYNLGPRNRSKWPRHSRLREFHSHGLLSSLTYILSWNGRGAGGPCGERSSWQQAQGRVRRGRSHATCPDLLCDRGCSPTLPGPQGRGCTPGLQPASRSTACKFHDLGTSLPLSFLPWLIKWGSFQKLL